MHRDVGFAEFAALLERAGVARAAMLYDRRHIVHQEGQSLGVEVGVGVSHSKLARAAVSRVGDGGGA